MEATPTTAAPAAPNQPAATPGVQPGDVKSAAAEAAAARKLKIQLEDGVEEEVDEQEVIKTYRDRKKHQAVASRELNEGKKARAQAEQALAMLKDPQKVWDVLKKLGHDPRKLSEAQLAAALEEELMDPKEKELRDHRTKLEKYEAAEREREEAAKQARLEEVKARYMKQYEKDFIEALESEDLPRNKDTVGRIASYIQRAAKLKYKITASDAAKLVRQDIQEAHQRLVGNADGETLLKLLGEDVANKIRQYDIGKLKNPNAELKTPVEQIRREKPTGRMSPKEWQKFKRSQR